MSKFVFVVGGVMSSIGKGATSASISKTVQLNGYKVNNVKCDMYVNIDAGTIRPAEHGEVFVTEDGIETDQDLGTYERFTGNKTSWLNYITTGQVYQEVIRKERNLEYGGEDVEVVPDVPNEIIRRIKLAQKKNGADVTVIEIGGTVGEYQVLLFLEAARMLRLENPDDVAFVIVSYLPVPKHLGEMKTKPTQYAVRSLNATGIQPDFIIARGECAIDEKRRQILAHMCNLPKENVIGAPDLDSIYNLPTMFQEQELDKKIFKTLNLEPKPVMDQDWKNFGIQLNKKKEPIKIALVGKYFKTGGFTLADTYISVIEAAKHAAWANNRTPEFSWLNADDFTDKSNCSKLAEYESIIVPGGFGERDVEGTINAIQFIRENKIPYLGICYGMQLACIEFARNVLGIKDATTAEVDPQSNSAIIHVNEVQAANIDQKAFGGTLRKGLYEATLDTNSKTYAAYGQKAIWERHRHRYEFNNKYKSQFTEAGMKLVGINNLNDLVEIVELENHPFFVGVQFHPEFQSSPLHPHKLFDKLVKEATIRTIPSVNKTNQHKEEQI
jgi:CTP synthase